MQQCGCGCRFRGPATASTRTASAWCRQDEGVDFVSSAKRCFESGRILLGGGGALGIAASPRAAGGAVSSYCILAHRVHTPPGSTGAANALCNETSPI